MYKKPFILSQIRDELYDLTDNYCVGSNTYRDTVKNAIIEYFNKEHPEITINWYDYTETICGESGIFFIAWIENDKLFTEGFEWKM